MSARLPWYGWQTSPQSAPESNQPYYAYLARGNYILVARDVPRTTRLTRAGGYAPAARSVGVVTVTNRSTGQSARTPPLGSGIVHGRLSRPITVAAGQSYEIRHTGTVFKAEADEFILRIFRVGTEGRANGRWPFETRGHGADRAELFTLPHPYFARAAGRPARVRVAAERVVSVGCPTRRSPLWAALVAWPPCSAQASRFPA
jgi:hypothetical protein